MREAPYGRSVSRRDLFRFGLAGAASAWLGAACQRFDGTSKPPDTPPPDSVVELSPSDALYDDFDGHGNLQSYDGGNLAIAGKLNTAIWVASKGWRVFDPGAGRGNVLELTCGEYGSGVATLKSPPGISFADFGSFRADVMLSSTSTAVRPYAVLNFHTTIPEQAPGRSWWVELGIILGQSDEAFIYGLYENYNTGVMQGDNLGAVALDEWHELRLDIVTQKDDPALTAKQLRIEYYADGILGASRIPEDSEILLDPSRIGLGPLRSLLLAKDTDAGAAVGCFDDVHAVYSDRVK